MVMPFGKFKGIEVRDLPEDYLIWLTGSVQLREPLATAVKRELDYRFRGSPIKKPKKSKHKGISVKQNDVALVREVFEAGYKAVARKKHPDTGGSEAEMVRLNLLVESLRDQLAVLEGRH